MSPLPRALSIVGLFGSWLLPRPAPADEPVSPRSLASAGGRPPECSKARGEGVDLWARARLPGLGKYCAALQRGTTLLSTAPDAALEQAELAEKVLPGRAAPSALSARAHAAKGAFEAAWKAFERARSLDPKSVEPPLTLLDYARSAARTGHAEEARRAYRMLSLRLEFFPDEATRRQVLTEAGFRGDAPAEPPGATPRGKAGR